MLQSLPNFFKVLQNNTGGSHPPTSNPARNNARTNHEPTKQLSSLQILLELLIIRFVKFLMNRLREWGSFSVYCSCQSFQLFFGYEKSFRLLYWFSVGVRTPLTSEPNALPVTPRVKNALNFYSTN